MLWVVLLMAALWLGGRVLGFGLAQRFGLIFLPWAAWLAVLLLRMGQSEAALRDALVWALLAPLAGGVWLYSRWLSGLKQRVREGQMAAQDSSQAAGEAAASEDQVEGAASGSGQGPLSPRELERYSRHILLREVGGPGQMRLSRAKVLVIGAGGLGAPVLQYLAAAGVGSIAVIDDDVVDRSNLHRQVIHDEAFIGKPKVVSAAERMRAQNPDVTVLPLEGRLGEAEAAQLFAEYDLILDGTDNFDTRYLANRAAVRAKKPLITGALTQWEGQVTLLDPARGGPCYECIFPDRPAAGLVPACSVAGVIGPLPGVIGAMMATEAVKHLTGAGEGLRERLLIWDALEAEMREIRTKRREACPVCCGDHA